MLSFLIYPCMPRRCMSPQIYYSINRDITQRAKCTKPEAERCAIFHIDERCATCYHMATGKTATQDTARRTEVDAGRKQERL